MFTQRDFFARDSILERQEILYDAIKNLNSTTFLEKKANAILYTKLIDPIITLKIKKQLPQINYIINNEQDLYNETKKKQIYNMVLNTNIERGDVMRLPLKKYIPKYKPAPIPDYSIQPNVSPYIMFSLHDFEQLLFNGKSKFKYYADTKISDYIYLNILEMLDVEHADELEHRPEWQAKLATFIRQTNFEPYYTKLAFQMDVVKYKGILIDVSFVPKLDIEAIAPIKNNFNDMDNDILIKYRDNLDVNSNKLIPVEYITIFLTFPFKDGFYISPDGRLHYLDFPKTQNMSAMKMIESIDVHHNFEGSLEDLARNLHVDELQKIAIYSKDIHLQGIALLALRHMLGDVVSFGPYRVQMPTIDAVLRWINYTNYTKKQLILPILAETMTMYTNIRLVRDIAKSCSTKRGAAFICSHYFIPECDYAIVWKNCTNNAEKYVLLTLILQEYNIYHFKKYRDSLQDVYFQSDPFPYENYNIGARIYINKDLSQKIQNNQIEMIKSTDIIKNLECNPDTCLEYYQFTNPQLAELADNGATQLDDDQYSAFLSLCI